jgi:hypothetical protein
MSNLTSLEEQLVHEPYEYLAKESDLLRRKSSFVLEKTEEIFNVSKDLFSFLGEGVEYGFLEIVKLFGGRTFVGSVIDIDNTFFELLKNAPNHKILLKLEESGSKKEVNLFDALRLVVKLKNRGFFERRTKNNINFVCIKKTQCAI